MLLKKIFHFALIKNGENKKDKALCEWEKNFISLIRKLVI